MKINQSKPRGFTLVELLVVIVIIGILASLITVAVSAAIGKARVARIQMEVAQLSGAMQNYKTKYGSFPPSTRPLLLNHIRSVFPRVAPQDLATLPPYMNAAEILWFCLRGYSSDPQRPVDYFNANARRDAFFEFDAGRLRKGRDFQVGQLNAFTMVYVQSEKDAPYVYFDCSRPQQVYRQQGGPDERMFPPAWEASAQNKYIGPLGTTDPNRTIPYVKPYVTLPSGSGQPQPANAGKFQIVAAGVDGDFGRYENAAVNKRYPEGANYTPEDNDNIVNFSDKTLENSKP